MRENKRMFWINLAIVLVLVAVVTVRSAAGGGPDVDFILDEESISLSGPGEFTVSVEFKELTSVEFRDSLDLGVCINGGSEGGYTYGIWENEEFGEYTLHVLTKVEAYMILTEADGDIVVLNLENARTTEAFSQNLIGHLQEKGYFPS